MYKMIKSILFMFVATLACPMIAMEKGINTAPQTRRQTKPELGWCSCPQAPEEQRFEFALKVIEWVKASFKPTDHIVYTSFASGHLYQDFLIIMGLIKENYTNITINIIDFTYKKDQNITRLFEQMIEKLARKSLRVNIYDNAYDYIQECEKDSSLKSDVFISVDVGEHPYLIYEAPKYPEAEQNLIHLVALDSPLDVKNQPEIVIFLPKSKYSNPVIYANERYEKQTIDLIKSSLKKPLLKDALAEIKVKLNVKTARFTDPTFVLYDLALQTTKPINNNIFTLFFNDITQTDAQTIARGTFESIFTKYTTPYSAVCLHGLKKR